MHKKDYILLAADLRANHQTLSIEESAGFALAIDILCRALQRDNPRFDSATFKKAALPCTCSPDLPTQKCDRYCKQECSPQDH